MHFGPLGGAATQYSAHSVGPTLTLHGSGSRNGRRAGRATFFEEKPQFGHMLGHEGFVDMLCEHVRWILGTEDLVQGEIALSDPILDP